LAEKDQEVTALKLECMKATECIHELTQQVTTLEVEELSSRPHLKEFPWADEMAALRRKYEDKCSEMMRLVKYLNTLIAFKNKTLKDNRTPSRSREASPLRVKKRSSKALNQKDFYVPEPSLARRVIQRSSSTERLQSKTTSRASSRSRGCLSSTARK
jgi:hypothetical protein